FRDCIANLQNLGLLDPVKGAILDGKPYLGICLGLQVLFEESEEFGRTRGLGILPGRVVRFPEGMGLKIPHMGWNQVHIKKPSAFFEGISDGDFFYFVHSYYVVPEEEGIITTTTDYGIEFVSSVQKDNIFAIQFHPEKSQSLGLRVIENFVKSLN
ncbi:MAG: imidazole glycerol phosphate synthase subunit HisH, partial [Nitrospirae bacterium]